MMLHGFFARPHLACSLALFPVFTVLACTPDIPNYEGFWDDEARKRCGNGEIDFHSEECDEGAGNSLAGFCSPTCKKARCGDGILQLDETCDLGSENNDVDYGSPGCSTLCHPTPYCGDGNLDEGYESCDDGNDDNNDACTNNCQQNVCGDGYLYSEFESCDDA
ncbi:MAG: hypothetical protein ACPG77_21330, partial [Nannocystaceae bacterium]